MQNSHESQAGVSLMLAVLVLAAITAIAFSLATIVFIEIKSSGDASRTEPALYATLGVTEEALFQYKRFYTPAQGGFDTASCAGPSGSNTCLLNGVTLTLPGTQPLDFDNSPRVEFVGAGTNRTIPLYTQGDDDNDDWNKVYERVGIEVLPNASSASISAYFVLTNDDGTTSNTVPVSVSPGNVYEYQGFVSTGQYELILSNPSSAQDLSVKISTVRVGNAQPDGLPFVGEQVFRIFADYLGLTRTYQVKIPLFGSGGSSPGDTSNDVVWVEDSVPSGATLAADGGDFWDWVNSNPAPFTGSSAHKASVAPGNHQHYFYNASSTLTVNAGESLIAYIYIDPASIPSEVMLQWNSGGSWEHRAFWGASGSSLIPYGTPGTNSKRYMGTVPAAGGWTRLEVPASQVGLEGATLNGAAFTLYNGAATWDHIGKAP